MLSNKIKKEVYRGSVVKAKQRLTGHYYKPGRIKKIAN
jgi:hypothetical protein